MHTYAPKKKLEAGGKPSTWLPPERLVEHSYMYIYGCRSLMVLATVRAGSNLKNALLERACRLKAWKPQWGGDYRKPVRVELEFSKTLVKFTVTLNKYYSAGGLFPGDATLSSKILLSL